MQAEEIGVETVEGCALVPCKGKEGLHQRLCEEHKGLSTVGGRGAAAVGGLQTQMVRGADAMGGFWGVSGWTRMKGGGAHPRT